MGIAPGNPLDEVVRKAKGHANAGVVDPVSLAGVDAGGYSEAQLLSYRYVGPT